MNFKTIVIMACIVGSVHMLSPVPETDQQALNNKIAALVPVANSINLINAPLYLIGQGPYVSIVAGILDIVATLTANTNAPTLAAYDIQQLSTCQLINILIGKAGLFQVMPYIGSPVVNVLQQFKSATAAMINAKQPTDNQLMQLDQFTSCVNVAIDAYNGLLAR